MIFVTVGAQMPFDRLIRSVDAWAGVHSRRDIFAQIGPSSYRPQHIRHSRFINPNEFRKNIEEADAVVAHAGMGSIISAVELGKPILVMPRRGDLGETRNDHQVATAERFSTLKLVQVAADEQELSCKLDELDRLAARDNACKKGRPRWSACPFAHDDVESCEFANNRACPHLLMALIAFFAGESPFDMILPLELGIQQGLVLPAPVEVGA